MNDHGTASRSLDSDSAQAVMRLYYWLLNRVLGLIARVRGVPRIELRVVRGFPVGLINTRPDIASDSVIERLGEALDLIERYQPARFAHLERDVRLFRVSREAHRGEYHRKERMVVTELTFLARRDISAAVVASSILHEGVHARISIFAPSSAGYFPAREERICRKAELAFGRALPRELGGPVVARAEESLALNDDDIAPRTNEAAGRARIAQVDGAATGRAS